MAPGLTRPTAPLPDGQRGGTRRRWEGPLVSSNWLYDILPNVTWPRLNLVLAALAFLVVLYGIVSRDWRIAIPAGVMAAVFGLEWIGVPVLGRWRRVQEDRKPKDGG